MVKVIVHWLSMQASMVMIFPEEYLKDATNEFGIINQYGGISTYFKPDEGIAYWLEQIEKYAPK